jgi:hypothetical protein
MVKNKNFIFIKELILTHNLLNNSYTSKSYQANDFNLGENVTIFLKETKLEIDKKRIFLIFECVEKI